MDFFSILYNSAQSPYLLFVLLIASAIAKINYIPYLLRRILSDKDTPQLFVFLLIGIIGALFCDISWFVKILQMLFITIPYAIVVFFIRVAWAALVIQYFYFSLFLESLTIRNFRFTKVHKLLGLVAGVLIAYFLFLAFFQPLTLISETERDIARETLNCLEFFIMSKMIYPILIFVAVGLYNAYRNIKRHKLPVILKKQLLIFTTCLVMPYLTLELSLGFLFKIVYEMIFIVSLSTFVLAIAIYYCLHHVLKLRFTNIRSRVEEKPNPYIIDNFKVALDQLSSAKTMEELSHITQAFFKESFSIPVGTVNLFIKESRLESSSSTTKLDRIEAMIKDQFTQTDCPSILVYDELAFTNFYQESAQITKIIRFLEELQIAVILPLYNKKEIVGYVTIDQHARKTCYSNAEQDAMSAFASYLGNIITIIQNKNLDILLSREKKLKDQLYTTHQEINQYKESVHTFLRRSKEKLLGIVFYKNGLFVCANHDAQKMIGINLNSDEGHPLYHAFRQVADYVQTYQTAHDFYTRDQSDAVLLLSGVPHLTKQSVIITVSYPEISDVIMKQMHLLHNPNDWHYLLYLMSTKAGTLINQFIPAASEQLLNIKIALLKAALHKKTLLIDAPQQDLATIVDIIHQISGREKIQTIELYQPTTPALAVTLFGDSYKKPLLDQLNNGTLFIKNSHFLDLETQQHLINYIKYGTYQTINGDQKYATNCRIICSSHQNSVELMQKGLLDHDLFRLLKKATIAIPSLLYLAPSEVSELIDGFADAIISTYALKKLFALTDKEKQKLCDQPPASIKELKMRIEQIILHKSDNHILEQSFDAPLNDPDIARAGKLGKHALKDPAIMQKLWDKFKNQNKIALFLGVNRSSVNRRFKFFEIGKEDGSIV